MHKHLPIFIFLIPAFVIYSILSVKLHCDGFRINIGLYNGLVPSGNSPLPAPMLTQIVSACGVVWPQCDNTFGATFNQDLYWQKSYSELGQWITDTIWRRFSNKSSSSTAHLRTNRRKFKDKRNTSGNVGYTNATVYRSQCVKFPHHVTYLVDNKLCSPIWF